jgi:hypothetical protein
MDCPSDGMGGTTDGGNSQRTRSGDSARQHGQQLGTTANQRGNPAANQGNETQPAQNGGEPEGSNLMDCPSDGMGGTTDGEDSQSTRSGDSARQHGQQLGTTANHRGN